MAGYEQPTQMHLRYIWNIKYLKGKVEVTTP